ncbi:M14 family zinc carboxypeptidase, partial [Hyunsoonleella rubra]
MKKITLLSILLLTIAQITHSQEILKRVSISNINSSTIEQLDALGIDMTCGAILHNHNLTLELTEHQLHQLENKGLIYNVLIDDMTKFYSERAIRNLPLATAEVERQKSLKRGKLALKQYNKLTSKSLTINELLNNLGQYDECDEMNWEVPDNWNLNDSDSYPNETNHFGGCLTYDMVLQELDDMKRLYPNLISTRKNASPTNQLTVEGRTVWFVRISDNPEVDEPAEPETLYQSLIHSREAASIMQLLYYMWYILENYESDDAIKNLVNNHAMYFIPVFNPDGFVYNETVAPNGGGGQRKNRNTSGGCGTYDEGIDLNRNSAYYWGNGGASTTNSCSSTYAGSGPFSENETQIMRDFFMQHDFKLALNHHSFKNVMLHGYAGTNIDNPRPDEYSKYNHDMTFYNRYGYGPSTSISSLNSGNMNDWMLGGPAGVSANGTPTGIGSGKHTLSWTPENGAGSEGTGGTYGGFWPDPTNYLPIAQRAMRANFLAAYFSGKYAKLHDLNQSDITSTSGNLTFGIENLGQNGNDTTPDTNNFTVTVTAVTPNITINTASASQNFTSSEILAQKTVDISYTLDGGIAANDEIQFKVVLTNDYASDNVLYETIITKIYTPTILSTLDPTNFSNWTSSGSWSSVTDGFNDASAIRSNASIPYSNNLNNQTLQYNGTLNFSGIQSAVIQFYGKWDLERSFDYVQIEASANGSTGWTPLCGRLTKPGSEDQDSQTGSRYSQKSTTNINFQPDGEQLYDGDTQDKWSMEEIVIDASTNSAFLGDSSVFIRFAFHTDSSNRQDSYVNANFEGFTFDDFKVIGIGCSTAVPTNIAASNITTDAATIDWDEVFNNTYDLRYRVNGTSTWTNVSDFNTNSNALSGLTPGTTYDVEIRSQCGTSTNSAYSATFNFSTLACDPPSNITASDIGLSTVRIHWDDIPDATYDVRYRVNGTSTWTSTSSTSLVLDQPVYNISGLSEATSYEVQVRTDCPGSGNSSYSTSVLFTTLGCVAPINITASELFIDSANITWDEIDGATFDVRYRENGTSTWTTVLNLDNNAFNIPNLDPNTTYDVQVRTDCSSSSSSYSSTVNFTTLACTAPTNVTADDVTSSSATINWDEILGSDYDLRFRETGTSTWTNISDRALNFYNIPDLVAATEYEVQVRTVCTASTNSAYTTSTVFTTSACDDIVSAFPYAESFESGFGLWVQESSDDIDWTRISGLTPSNTSPDVTGPSGAADGSYYIFTESSGNGTGYPDMDAFLTSPCFDFTGYENTQLTFQYHMFGSTMGDLYVIVSTDNFQSSNVTVFTQLGSPSSQTTGNSDPWESAMIDLSAYDGQTIKIRFFGETGSGFRSDISIDDINVSADVISSTTWYADTDSDGFGDPSVSQVAGSQPAGYVADNTDCDDGDPNEFPGQTWYLDADGDGYSEGTSTTVCERPTDYYTAAELTATSGDCDDTDGTVNTPQQYYVDADGDGFGSTTTAMLC